MNSTLRVLRFSMHIIAGKHRKRKLSSPKGSHVRPTSNAMRESVFNITQHLVVGAKFLDLFSGSGAMALEAISRGAEKAVLVEKHRNSIQCIKANIRLLQENSCVSVMGMDVMQALQKLVDSGQTFDLVFCDPPYGIKRNGEKEKSYAEEILLFFDSNALLSEHGILFFETEQGAVLNEDVLETLILKKQRPFGSSILWQFCCRS